MSGENGYFFCHFALFKAPVPIPWAQESVSNSFHQGYFHYWLVGITINGFRTIHPGLYCGYILNPSKHDRSPFLVCFINLMCSETRLYLLLNLSTNNVGLHYPLVIILCSLQFSLIDATYSTWIMDTYVGGPMVPHPVGWSAIKILQHCQSSRCFLIPVIDRIHIWHGVWGTKLCSVLTGFCYIIVYKKCPATNMNVCACFVRLRSQPLNSKICYIIWLGHEAFVCAAPLVYGYRVISV